MNDRNSRRIKELVKKEGNNICSDCGAENPTWASYNLGVFLCTTCASYHRKLGSHISKVKSLNLDTWEDLQAEKLECSGNVEAMQKYQKHVPACYRKPKPGDPLLLLEQWVRAKYERLEFIHVDKQIYTKGHMEDILQVKKRKDTNSYTPKKFILSEKENSLSIFNKEDARDKDPKITIQLSELNVSLAPAKMGQDNCMQLSFISEGSTRHIFVCHENGEVIINWYMGIRSAKLNRLMVAYPSATVEELLPYLTNDFVMEGWLSKTGPGETDAYRRRWFTLDDRKLMYHVNPLDEIPRGEIFLGHKDDNFSIEEGVPKGCKELDFPFFLVTPERTFVLSSNSSEERSKWLEAISNVLERPLRPQDNQCKVSLEVCSKKRTSRHSTGFRNVFAR